MIKKMTIELDEEFQGAVEAFAKVVNQSLLISRKSKEFVLIENYLDDDGREIQRLIAQGIVNLLHKEEQREEGVIGSDGEWRHHMRERERSLTTIFGRIEIVRNGYSDHGLTHFFPIDSQLNLPPRLMYSHAVAERIGKAAAFGSYDHAIEQVNDHTHVKVSKKQALEMAINLTTDYDDYYKTIRYGPPANDSKASIQVISVDGKGIVMRHDDLRDETKKRAQSEKHKLKCRLSQGEKRNRKRMSTVAAVYEIEPHFRSAEQIMVAEERETRPPEPRPENKRVWASVEKKPAEVIDTVFSEAARRDPKREKDWVVVVDGQEEQLRQIYLSVTRYNAKTIVILDFVHVLEYLWGAAWCLFSPGDVKAEEWVSRYALDILNGNASQVAAGMRRSATNRGIPKSKRKALDKCADYLLKNIRRLDYAEALEKGYPIGSGVIEGACRHLVKERMEKSGARWSLEGAEAMLQLRALCLSGDWDDYRIFHRMMENKRNYFAWQMYPKK